MPWDRSMVHWTQQVLKKVTRARYLVRESHQWASRIFLATSVSLNHVNNINIQMARNNEAELSAELRQIECALVMVFEDNRLRPSPPEARLPPSQPPTGPRRGNHHNRG
ncbi:unnamed protein product [Penicillium crustosum]